MTMGILNNPNIIQGVNPIKEKPKFSNYPEMHFDKKLPIHAHNFPLTKWTIWEIYGYRKDPYTGIKRPHWVTKKLPTGKSIAPRDVGLDGFFDVKTRQVEWYNK